MLSNFLKKLIFARQFAMIDGRIEILSERFMLIHSKILIRALKGEDVTNPVKLETNKIAKRLGVLKGPEFVKYFKHFFEVFGLGEIHIVDMDIGKKRAIIRLQKSTIANTFISEKIKSDKPVCKLTGQILAGMLSYVFSKNVKAEERDCMVLGKEYCQFIVK